MPLNQENNLSDSIARSNYYCSKNTRHLFQVPNLKKTPFHENGSNLAICLLSLNRVHLTIKLISSIEYFLPDFKGEILIIDNNSAPAQKETLKGYISTSPVIIRLIELNENLGVGNARNFASEHTDKDWLMFLDNDMYFIKDPLPVIKKAIELLGVHFLNLPLINYDNKTVFALGGALFTYPLEKGHFLGGGSSFDFKRSVEHSAVKIETPFLSDFLFGGASVLHREKFVATGGFDKNMFVGFEDIDFSLRLYNAGIKVGNINEFLLVHNHKPSSNLDDVEAEKKRFNNSVIKSSAEAFSKKTGLTVYDQHTDDWLKKKQSDLINHVAKSQSKLNDVSRKKSVALIVDTRDWAFHNIARSIQQQLGHKYEFTIYFQSDYKDEKWLEIYPVLYRERFDIILFFWRPYCKFLYSPIVASYLENECNISEKAFTDFLNNTIILTCVYDHLYLTEDEIRNNKPIFTNHVDGYIVSSQKLNKIYNAIPEYKQPYTVIQDGIDFSRFYRKETRQPSIESQPLVVGWAGNSRWGMHEDGIDHKGFVTIIKPVLESLIKEGYNIRLAYADKQEPSTLIPQSGMNDFYNSLDVYVCTSDIEGTPNPVLESMACGIAIITTDVGIVKEALGRDQQQFIMEQRTKECLREKLLALLKDRSLLEKLGKENLIRIQSWSWENQCEKFDEFFEYYLFKKSINSTHHKRFPFTIEMPAPLDIEILQQNGIEHTTNTSSIIDMNKFVLRSDHEEQYKEVLFWKQNAVSNREWYYKEYEVLPLWFKRLGHIVKLMTGHRKFNSFFRSRKRSDS